jgi:hypothetical protein
MIALRLHASVFVLLHQYACKSTNNKSTNTDSCASVCAAASTCYFLYQNAPVKLLLLYHLAPAYKSTNKTSTNTDSCASICASASIYFCPSMRLRGHRFFFFKDRPISYDCLTPTSYIERARERESERERARERERESLCVCVRARANLWVCVCMCVYTMCMCVCMYICIGGGTH